MKNFYFLLFCVCLTFGVYGQDLTPVAVCSGSNNYTDNNMSWCGTIGGIFSETLSNTDCILSQGFQQGESAVMGVEEEKYSGQISILPNPVNGVFTLDYSVRKVNGPISIFIYNLNGVITHYEADIGSGEEVDVTSLSGGIYVLKLFMGYNQSTVIKFIKL